MIHHLYLFFEGKLNENSFRYLRDLLATMVDVDNGDKKEYIKKLINIFFCHVIHHLYLFFKGKSNENSFKYLRVLLATMVDVDDGDQKEYIRKLINIFFVM